MTPKEETVTPDLDEAGHATTAGEPVAWAKERAQKIAWAHFEALLAEFDKAGVRVPSDLAGKTNYFGALKVLAADIEAALSAHPSPDSDLLREALAGIDWRSIVQLQIARMKDAGESHEMLARWITTEIRTRLDAALSAAPAGGEVERLREALRGCLKLEQEKAKTKGYRDCCCMAWSRDTERAYEAGKCPHQIARAALNEGGSDNA